MQLGWELAGITQILVFGITSIACFAAVVRIRTQIDDPETRWGLVSLLVLCGVWSASTAGRLLIPNSDVQVASYVLGLVVGLAAVGSWLYFCSAYTGRTYHRDQIYRWSALSLFLIISFVKITSPIHGFYFTTSSHSTAEVVIELGTLYWIVAGLAYTLSAVGFYMLFDLFKKSTYVTTRLSILVAFAGVPGVFTIFAYVNSGVTIVSYEPVGVALFAFGVFTFADGTFLAVQQFGREQIIDELNEGIVILDSDGVVRDINTPAKQLFPELSNGDTASSVVPDIAEYALDESQVVTIDTFEPPEHYLVSTNTLSVGETIIGQAIVFSDVTEIEQTRREIKQHRIQRNDFSEAITHELRNALNISKGHLGLVKSHLEPDQDVQVDDSLATVVSITDRMEQIVSNLAMIATYGQPVEQTMRTDISSVAQESWNTVSVSDVELLLTTDATIEADPTRLKKTIRNPV